MVLRKRQSPEEKKADKEAPKESKAEQLERYRNGPEGFFQWVEENVWSKVYIGGSDVSEWLPMSSPRMSIPTPGTGKTYRQEWAEQKRILREALRMENGRFIYRLIVFCWQRGEGKCQIKGSKVIMFDGTLKKVEDIKVGDLLMGPDSTSRKVLSLASGEEELFEVVPNRGNSLTVTLDHMLTLKKRRQYKNRRGKPYHDSDAGKIIDISLKNYLKQNKSFKSLHLLFRVPVEFPEKKVLIDPYFLGLWLGDGHAHIPIITSMDVDVSTYLQKYANQLGLRVTVGEKKGTNAKTYSIVGERLGISETNILLNYLREYGLIKNKHIPNIYKSNSREIRLKLLAGLVDSDGYVNRKSIQITQKNKKLSYDIVFLARSLGFSVNITKCVKGIKGLNFYGEYYTIGITGDCSVIPTKIKRKKCPKRSNWKDHSVTGIKEVRSVGVKEYYGFTLDKDGRYLTEDFTVTHNSFIVCLIQMWKFFCWPNQHIVLCANSKDQTKFVHYDIIRDTILNSPLLLDDIGEHNVKEKEIRLRDGEGNITSSIKAISSFSGIVSNINGYTFSEIFDMKNPKFFTQVDGSIRGVPNALGVIDSTVSEKSHILYQLHTQYVTGKTKTLFFSYRYSVTGDYKDYWNPNMDEAQLNDYRSKFPFGAFEAYFLNLWSAGVTRIFTDEHIKEMGILGADNSKLNHNLVKNSISELTRSQINLKKCTERRQHEGAAKERAKITAIEYRLISIETVYNLSGSLGNKQLITIEDLNRLSECFDTDFSVLAGTDFGDPLATSGLARTMCAIILKGLMGSKSNPNIVSQNSAPKYLYLLAGVLNSPSHSMDEVKEFLDEVGTELDGIDALASERYGAWDLVAWCDDRDISPELIYPTYKRQAEAFKFFYGSVNEGLFKAPELGIPGSKSDNVFTEEMMVFNHNMEKKQFGSPEKFEKTGIQDDSLYATAWAIYSGRDLTIDDFRIRKQTDLIFGMSYPGERLEGSY